LNRPKIEFSITNYRAKIEAGKVELEIRPFCLRSTIETITTLLSLSCNENKEVSVVSYIDPRIPMLSFYDPVTSKKG
jgi:hypothetical protein